MRMRSGEEPEPKGGRAAERRRRMLKERLGKDFTEDLHNHSERRGAPGDEEEQGDGPAQGTATVEDRF